MRVMNFIKFAGVTIVGLFPLAVQAETYTNNFEPPRAPETADKDWRVSLGAGVLVKPEYEGAEDYEALPLPYIDIDYKDLITFNPFEGLRYHAFKENGVTLGAGLGYDFGREEGDSDHLRGLGDVDGSIEGQVFGQYEFGQSKLELEIAQGISDGHDGLTVGASAAHAFFIPAYRAVISPSVGVTYASEDYMDSYFSVNGAQSARSGLAQYSADQGFKDVSARLFARMPISESWSLNGYASYSRLIGEAADSPIVQDEDQYMGGAFFSYSF
ncbi:MAG: MipA/OmpV family protein [Micavibrio sp.]|nr:MipA/OmpV family protein [Micavibrio sp.]